MLFRLAKNRKERKRWRWVMLGQTHALRTGASWGVEAACADNVKTVALPTTSIRGPLMYDVSFLLKPSTWGAFRVSASIAHACVCASRGLLSKRSKRSHSTARGAYHSANSHNSFGVIQMLLQTQTIKFWNNLDPTD